MSLVPSTTVFDKCAAGCSSAAILGAPPFALLAAPRLWRFRSVQRAPLRGAEWPRKGTTASAVELPSRGSPRPADLHDRSPVWATWVMASSPRSLSTTRLLPASQPSASMRSAMRASRTPAAWVLRFAKSAARRSSRRPRIAFRYIRASLLPRGRKLLSGLHRRAAGTVEAHHSSADARLVAAGATSRASSSACGAPNPSRSIARLRRPRSADSG
jgi:hypothetical protein